MGIRERVVKPDGTVVHVPVAGYEDKPVRKIEWPKELNVKTKTKQQAKVKPAVKKEKPKQVSVPKKAFKATVMAVNDENVYSKAKEIETDEVAAIKNALNTWLSNGGCGQFNVYRRK